jgi:CheY-like chemotaxis protein
MKNMIHQMRKILIVDDDEAIQTVMQTVLEGEGYEVVCASSGSEAMDLLLRQGIKVDLIFLDLYMPGMSGLQFADSLRSQTPETQNRIPIVVTSATSKATEREIALTFDGFLQKPFSLEKLLNISQQFCNKDS